MKKFLFYIISAVLVFAAAFGITEYLDGDSILYLPEKTDIYKVRDERAGEDRAEFYEGENREELLNILSEMKIKNRKTRINAVQGDDIKYRIYLYNGEKNYFIYLGKMNLVSEGNLGTGGNAYEIVNSDEVISKIEALLAERD